MRAENVKTGGVAYHDNFVRGNLPRVENRLKGARVGFAMRNFCAAQEWVKKLFKSADVQESLDKRMVGGIGKQRQFQTARTKGFERRTRIGIPEPAVLLGFKKFFDGAGEHRIGNPTNIVLRERVIQRVLRRVFDISLCGAGASRVIERAKIFGERNGQRI